MLTNDRLVGLKPPSHALGLEHEVADSFLSMQADFNKEVGGQDHCLAIASSFRGFEQQLAIWNDKWTGKRPLLDALSNPLDASRLSDTDKLWAILCWSALPGGSRHHWGTDLDIYDQCQCKARGHQLQLTPDEYQQDGPCGLLHQWLTNHAGAYGFSFPYDKPRGGVLPEPWHLSYLPLSQQYLQALTPALLAAVLADAPIQGKAVILANLDEIYQRFIRNVQYA